MLQRPLSRGPPFSFKVIFSFVFSSLIQIVVFKCSFFPSKLLSPVLPSNHPNQSLTLNFSPPLEVPRTSPAPGPEFLRKNTVSSKRLGFVQQVGFFPQVYCSVKAKLYHERCEQNINCPNSTG